MEETIKKNRTSTIVLSMLIVLTVIGVTTYALWQLTRKQTNRNVVKTTCLNITFGNESGDIDLQNVWPTSDADGANLTPYTFTITNTCSGSVNYSVALESITDNENYITDYLDYNYIKVKLDDETPAIYDDLDALTNDNGVRATKELAHHTLAGGTSVTHSVRIWVDESTPLQNEDESYNTEKYFFGKIKVIAGQGVEGDPTTTVNENLKVLSASGEPTARLSNISIGDRLGYQGEEFYVVGIDGNNVKLLSRYLLNVGDHKNPNVAEGLQSMELGYTRPDVDENSPITYGGFPRYGAVSFSSSNYWWDYNNGTWISPYTANSFVYNENASISEYVNDYVQTLQTMGLSVTNGTLLSLEEVSTLCNTTITSYGNYSSQCPSYLFETSYWLGSAFDYRVWYVGADGYLNCTYYDYDYDEVRPVINITLQ